MTDDEERGPAFDDGDGSIEESGASLVTLEERPPERLLVVDLPGVVLFPGMALPLVVAPERQRQVMEQAWNQTRFVALVAARRELSEEELPEPRDLYRMGVAAKLLRFRKRSDGNVQVLVQCIARAKIVRYVRTRPVLFADVSYPEESFGEPLRTEALLTTAKDTLAQVLSLMPTVTAELNLSEIGIEEAGRLADFVAGNFDLKPEQRQGVLEAVNVTDRLEKVLIFLSGELTMRRLGARIQQEIQEKIEKSQKEWFLREQLKVIRRELGEEVDERQAARSEYDEKIEAARMPEEVEARARQELGRLAVLPPEASEHHVIKTYLDWLVELPWSKLSDDNHDIRRAERILDEDHHGLREVKERIVEYLAVRKLQPKLRGAILCFAGPPGVGKTSLGKSIARSLGREFFRFSLGGMRDEAEIKGHRRTYVGALPGKIIQGLRRVGTRNPVFMLDEIDKLGSDWRGDPSSALLEVLDPEQNDAFLDHYLDMPFDLSDVMFIATANVKSSIPQPLLDRMEVIDLPGYIDDEKYHIAARYLLPRQRERHGLRPGHVRISRSAYLEVIDGYTRESGVRNLERQIARICRKTAAAVARGDSAGASVTRKNLGRLLGPRKYHAEVVARTNRPGVAVGLAWTPVGGEVLFIEVTRTRGKGALQLTGQLGEVMSESARIALTYVKSEAERLGIAPEAFDNVDIHAHFPAGAIPKDGPSAGVTIATALVSLFSGQEGRPVRPRLAMTGELTLTGNVLPVGGIREKVLAARRAGIREVLVPARNRDDYEEIPEHVLKGLRVHFVETYRDVFARAFDGE